MSQEHCPLSLSISFTQSSAQQHKQSPSLKSSGFRGSGFGAEFHPIHSGTIFGGFIIRGGAVDLLLGAGDSCYRLGGTHPVIVE